jgi:hypothetical protein
MSEQPSPAAPQSFPGIAAIGLYMFLLCVVGLVGVTRHALPPVALVFSTAFAVAGQGLLRRKRWGWALTLAAVLLAATWALWIVFRLHQLSMLGMAAVNMILFLYLVRPEVRERMK